MNSGETFLLSIPLLVLLAANFLLPTVIGGAIASTDSPTTKQEMHATQNTGLIITPIKPDSEGVGEAKSAVRDMIKILKESGDYPDALNCPSLLFWMMSNMDPRKSSAKNGSDMDYFYETLCSLLKENHSCPAVSAEARRDRGQDFIAIANSGDASLTVEFCRDRLGFPMRSINPRSDAPTTACGSCIVAINAAKRWIRWSDPSVDVADAMTHVLCPFMFDYGSPIAEQCLGVIQYVGYIPFIDPASVCPCGSDSDDSDSGFDSDSGSDSSSESDSFSDSGSNSGSSRGDGDDDDNSGDDSNTNPYSSFSFDKIREEQGGGDGGGKKVAPGLRIFALLSFCAVLAAIGFAVKRFRRRRSEPFERLADDRVDGNEEEVELQVVDANGVGIE